MKRTDFSYELPRELIAQEPRERGRSRMLVVTPWDGGPALLEHRTFAAFPSMLGRGDVLVVNDTRVIPARLFAEPKGAMKKRIELLLTRQLDGQTWQSWCRPAKRIRAGDALRFSPSLAATVMEKRADGSVVLRFEGEPSAIASAIEQTGVPPLPPYIEREAVRNSDREAYQTVYAANAGAIAAPTAGLHFTNDILEAIARGGVEIARLTLHVGIGTFQPVKAENVEEHRMESERYDIPVATANLLNRALDQGRRIVAVGTTSVRTLESAVRAGGGRFVPGWNETSLFITPGFEFLATHALLTNFHLPESTLLMLVSAFAGSEAIRSAYAAAIHERYFFYSYGDCMFIAKKGER